MLKNFFFLITLSAAISSCGENSDQTQNHADSTNAAHFEKDVKKTDSVVSPAPAVSIATSSDKGAQLIIQNDCRNCHKEQEKLIGPAFTAIAKKYTLKDIDALASKVIKGGAGNWGDISMSAHPSLQKNEAKEMVAFILKMK
ncbi:c-type cytochrome [Mucilaginibacter sp. HC2]|uniref:c-type cytochrome n=1 Tax=Mucilaginibacter inviolabilis TaxID=2714892 RepID=UPI00140D8F9B|nr:c-type cytochrome [Mucilaginibacter inviolabilis]NHA02417.1 c-type cytochrome [Mucilaginibacter inviolabilis]